MAGMGIIILVILLLVPLFLPRVFGYGAYHVVSGSMEPEIPTGSLILVKETDPAVIRPGEVIAFMSGAGVTAHRVKENRVDRRQFITKGDANEKEDIHPVSYPDCLGVVTRHYREIGGVMAFLSGTAGKLCLFALIGAGVLLQAAGTGLSRRAKPAQSDAGREKPDESGMEPDTSETKMPPPLQK